MRRINRLLLLGLITLISLPTVSASSIVSTNDGTFFNYFPLILSLIAAIFIRIFFIPSQLSNLQVAFEVGDDVRQAFLKASCGEKSMSAFVKGIHKGKYFANLYDLARIRLASKGVDAVYGGGECTYTDVNNYFSYRRDGITGRMASFIYIKD